jgi:hypothetical protein
MVCGLRNLGPDDTMVPPRSRLYNLGPVGFNIVVKSHKLFLAARRSAAFLWRASYELMPRGWVQTCSALRQMAERVVHLVHQRKR